MVLTMQNTNVSKVALLRGTAFSGKCLRAPKQSRRQEFSLKTSALFSGKVRIGCLNLLRRFRWHAWTACPYHDSLDWPECCVMKCGGCIMTLESLLGWGELQSRIWDDCALCDAISDSCSICCAIANGSFYCVYCYEFLISVWWCIVKLVGSHSDGSRTH